MFLCLFYKAWYILIPKTALDVSRIICHASGSARFARTVIFAVKVARQFWFTENDDAKLFFVIILSKNNVLGCYPPNLRSVALFFVVHLAKMLPLPPKSWIRPKRGNITNLTINIFGTVFLTIIDTIKVHLYQNMIICICWGIFWLKECFFFFGKKSHFRIRSDI